MNETCTASVNTLCTHQFAHITATNGSWRMLV